MRIWLSLEGDLLGAVISLPCEEAGARAWLRSALGEAATLAPDAAARLERWEPSVGVWAEGDDDAATEWRLWLALLALTRGNATTAVDAAAATQLARRVPALGPLSRALRAGIERAAPPPIETTFVREPETSAAPRFVDDASPESASVEAGVEAAVDGGSTEMVTPERELSPAAPLPDAVARAIDYLVEYGVIDIDALDRITGEIRHSRTFARVVDAELARRKLRVAVTASLGRRRWTLR